MIPESLYYTKDHEWVKLDGEEATVGITFHAQKELGDIVYLELPEVGRTLKVGEEFGTVESPKAVSELFSPLSGEVLAVNSALTEDPDNSATVNRDPYGEGWMIRMRLSVAGEVDGLLSSDGYRSYVDEAGD